MVDVRAIEQVGPSALVQWQDKEMLRRATVPVEALSEDGHKCPQDVLNQGVEYGVDWAAHLSLTVTERDVAEGLKQANIWTADDLASNFDRARKVLVRLYMADFMRMVKEVRNAEH